jgi:hypothetical protein
MEVESGSGFSSITNSTTNKSDLGTFSGISNLHFWFQCKWSRHSPEHKFFLMFVSKYSTDHSPIGFKVCNPLCKPRRKVLLVVWGLCLEYCKTPLQTWRVSVCGGVPRLCTCMFCVMKRKVLLRKAKTKQNCFCILCSLQAVLNPWPPSYLEDPASNQ